MDCESESGPDRSASASIPSSATARTRSTSGSSHRRSSASASMNALTRGSVWMSSELSIRRVCRLASSKRTVSTTAAHAPATNPLPNNKARSVPSSSGKNRPCWAPIAIHRETPRTIAFRYPMPSRMTIRNPATASIASRARPRAPETATGTIMNAATNLGKNATSITSAAACMLTLRVATPVRST